MLEHWVLRLYFDPILPSNVKQPDIVARGSLIVFLIPKVLIRSREAALTTNDNNVLAFEAEHPMGAAGWWLNHCLDVLDDDFVSGGSHLQLVKVVEIGGLVGDELSTKNIHFIID